MWVDYSQLMFLLVKSEDKKRSLCDKSQYSADGIRTTLVEN